MTAENITCGFSESTNALMFVEINVLYGLGNGKR